MDGYMERYMVAWIHGYTPLDRQTDGWIYGWIHALTHGSTPLWRDLLDGDMDGWTDGMGQMTARSMQYDSIHERAFLGRLKGF
jgi:hypothetical protein